MFFGAKKVWLLFLLLPKFKRIVFMRKNILRFNGLLLVCLLSAFTAFAQKSLVYDDADQVFKSGVELFQKQKYGSAQNKFEKVIRQYEGEYSVLKAEAKYYSAICAIELFNKDAEYLMNRFLNDHPESPKVKHAYFQMGRYQFRKKKYKKVIEELEKVDVYDLDNTELAEYYFKLGYSCFVEEKFEKSSKAFYEIKDVDNKYNAPALYYYAHIAYLNENNETALQNFQKLSKNEIFAPIVPYYITQIYFRQDRYDKVIDYAPALLESATTKRAPEIARVIGESYYRTFKYREAIPFLERYREEAGSYDRADIYELGYAYYRVNDYIKAGDNFKYVANAKDSLAQNAYYHLGDCFLKLGDKREARLAFLEVSKYDFNPVLKEDALYNYAKLTYETSFSPFNDAIKAFNQYIGSYPDSERLDEVYSYLGKVFMTTKNYKDALTSLENIKKVTGNTEEIYQKVAFFRGVDLYKNQQFRNAIIHFDKSLKSSKYNKQYKAPSLYWKAESYYQLKKYDKSISNYKEFLLLHGAYDMPEYRTAHYNLGYAYFKKKQYSEASSWFRKYTKYLKGKESATLADAYNRIGDCFFVASKYDNAVGYYDQAIQINKLDADYALFQKGFSLGLIKNYNQKVIVLTQLVTDFPNSAYVDDALFETAKSYEMIEAYDMAINNFQTIIDDYPSSSYVKKAHLQQGLINYNLDKSEEALMAYKVLVDDFQGTTEAKDALAGIERVYVDINEIDTYLAYVKGLGDFAKISVSEEDSLTYISAEKVYMDGDCSRSKEQFKKYIQRFEKGSFLINAHYYKAGCNLKDNEKEQALRSYEHVVSQPANNFTEQAMLNAAQINYSLTNYNEALEKYIKLKDIADYKSNLLKAKLGVMRCNYLLENLEQANDAADEVLGVEKLSDYVKQESHYIKAKYYYSAKDLEQALEEFMQLSQKTKTKYGAEAKFSVAEIFYLQEQYDLAEKEILNFVEKNTPHQYWLGRSFVLYADVYLARDDAFQAKATLQSIIDNYGDKEDGIIELASQNLEKIIEAEKAEEEAVKEEDIELNFEGNTEGQYDELFEEETSEEADTVSILPIKELEEAGFKIDSIYRPDEEPQELPIETLDKVEVEEVTEPVDSVVIEEVIEEKVTEEETVAPVEAIKEAETEEVVAKPVDLVPVEKEEVKEAVVAQPIDTVAAEEVNEELTQPVDSALINDFLDAMPIDSILMEEKRKLDEMFKDDTEVEPDTIKSNDDTNL